MLYCTQQFTLRIQDSIPNYHSNKKSGLTLSFQTEIMLNHFGKHHQKELFARYLIYKEYLSIYSLHTFRR